jgi:hypothetical protein
MGTPLDPQAPMDDSGSDDLLQSSRQDDQSGGLAGEESGAGGLGFSDGDEGSQLPTGRPPGGQQRQ